MHRESKQIIFILEFFCALIWLFPYAANAYTTLSAADGEKVSWKQSCIQYTIYEEGASDMEFDDLADAVRESFDEWEQVDCSYFYFEETEPATCTEIGFNMAGGNMNLLVWRKSGWPYEDAAMALTTLSYDDRTGRILDADIEFNNDIFVFTLEKGSGFADLRNTATHEIGHVLGMDHSTDPEATMYAFAFPGDTNKRSVEEDDKAGVCYLYPLEDDPDVCEEPVCGLVTDCNYNDCVAIKEDKGSDCSVTNAGWKPAGSSRPGLLDIIRYVF